MELDERIIVFNIEVNGVIKSYRDIALSAQGSKFATGNQNECSVVLTNLDNATANYILTETSPLNLNRTLKQITIDAGRKSFGTSRIFVGDIWSSSISQPPDKALTLKVLTSNFAKGVIVSRNQPATTMLSTISQQVAQDLNINLNFQATDKAISNYSFTGPMLRQVQKLGEMGAVNAYVDDKSLIVKDIDKPLPGKIRVLDMDSGMIGVPEITELGIKVKFLLDNFTTLGGTLRIKSKNNPAANGDYQIFKLGFEIANRDVPFYWIAEARR